MGAAAVVNIASASVEDLQAFCNCLPDTDQKKLRAALQTVDEEVWILAVQSAWSESLELQLNRELATLAKDHGLHFQILRREREIRLCGGYQELEGARDSLMVLWREMFGDDEAIPTQLKKIETLQERRVIEPRDEEWILAVQSTWSTSLELQLSRELGTLTEEHGLHFQISGSMREIRLCGTSPNLQSARDSLRVLWREIFGDDEALPAQLEKTKTHSDLIALGPGDINVELTTVSGGSCRLVGLSDHDAVEAILVAAATWCGIPADEVQLVIDGQDILQWNQRTQSTINSGIFDGSCVLCVRSR